VRENLKDLDISGPGVEYGTSRTKTIFANHNTMNFGNAEYLSTGLSVFFPSFLYGLDNDSFSERDGREFVDKPKRILLSLR
jgi:hypothetical protein